MSANETRPSATSASIEVHRRRADERRDEQVRRVVEEVLRRVDLLQQAVAEHGDPLPERHRLDLVVRHVDGRHAEPLVQLRELGAHRDAQLRVEVRERLVHQERLRLAHDRPPHRDALPLPARERRRLAVEQLLEPERLRDLVDAPLPLRLRQLLQLEPEGEVLPHRHVRIERVVLEDHRDVALLRRHLGDVDAADRDVAVRDVLEAGDHAQQRRLAAAGRADEDAELALGDLERELVDGPDAVRIDLRDLVERDPAHAALLSGSAGASGPDRRRPAGISSPCARISSSQSASISSSVSVAARCGSSIAACRMWSGSALEHCAHGQLDDVRRRSGSAQRAAAGSRAPASAARRCDRRRTEPRRTCPRAAPGSGPCSGRCRRSTLGSPVTIELTIDAAYSFERSSGIASPRASALLHPLELLEVLLAAADVLADRDAVALELVVVAHEPGHVLGGVLARLGREVAEPPVERDAHAALELGVGGDPLVEPRVERSRRRARSAGGTPGG